jgi:hypothetical protein
MKGNGDEEEDNDDSNNVYCYEEILPIRIMVLKKVIIIIYSNIQ